MNACIGCQVDPHHDLLGEIVVRRAGHLTTVWRDGLGVNRYRDGFKEQMQRYMAYTAARQNFTRY